MGHHRDRGRARARPKGSDRRDDPRNELFELWGAPLRRQAVERAFRRAVKAAGLPEGTTPHDLRHYYAALLIRHGESVKVVQARLGHATAGETLDTYAHLWPDAEDTTRDAIDSVLGAPADSVRTETGTE